MLAVYTVSVQSIVSVSGAVTLRCESCFSLFPFFWVKLKMNFVAWEEGGIFFMDVITPAHLPY